MYDKLLKYALYSVTLNLIFTPLSTGIARIFGYISIILFFLYPVLNSYSKGKIRVKKEVVVLGILLIISIVTSITHLFPINFEELEALIIAVVSLFIFYWNLSMSQNEKSAISINDLMIANYLLCAMYIVYAFGPFSFKYDVVDEYNNLLFTLGLGNPNGVSFCVMFSIAMLCLSVFNQGRMFFKILNILLISALVVVLLMLSSRTVVLCVLVLIGYFIFRFKRIGKFLPFVIIFLPFVAILFQLFIGVYDFDYQILGKAISTGRFSIYTSFFDSVASNPWQFIFGDMCGYRLTNLHNGMLTIFSSLGVAGVVFYLYFWIKQVNIINNNAADVIERFAFVTLLVFLLHSSSETMSVIGTVPHSLFVLIFTKIAKGEIVFNNERITKNSV